MAYLSRVTHVQTQRHSHISLLGAHIYLQVFIYFPLNVSGGSERGNISEIRDLINLEMPQLNEAMSPSTASTQVTDISCGDFLYSHAVRKSICSDDRHNEKD